MVTPILGGTADPQRLTWCGPMIGEASETEKSVDVADQSAILRGWSALGRAINPAIAEPTSWEAAARMVAAMHFDSGRAQNVAETFEPNHQAVLRHWGSFGSRLNRVVTSQVPWEAATRMVVAAEHDSKRAVSELRALLSESSSNVFARLGDPLDPRLNFGVHRWLKNSREEVYSDWFAWVIQQQRRVEEVLSLFELSREELSGEAVVVEREVVTPHGRLDLLIRFGNRETLVVEVKTGSEPDLEQLDRYSRWLREQSAPLGVVLLAYEEPAESLPEGVRFCPWQRVAEHLRGWARRSLSESRGIEAAMTLALCGAIERNILGFGTEGLEALPTANYLEAWMKGVRNAKNRV